MKKTLLISSFIICSFGISCSPNSSENSNKDASIQSLGDLEENPLLLTPLTSSIQPQNQTMSTLYGNKIAANHAQEFQDSNYPKGAVLYEVTWKQKPDIVWFGGNITKQINKVERISYLENNQLNYEIFKGDSLIKESVNEIEKHFRTEYIASKKIAVSP